MMTWYSDRISSSNASVSTSTRSTSSISSTTGILGGDRLEQRPGQQELVAEDVVVDLAPRVAVAVGLDAQQLLLVVPLVQRLGLVEALVALQADEPGPGHLGDALGELGLAGAGGPFHQYGLAESISEEHDAGDSFVGEIVDVFQSIANLLNAVETVTHGLAPYRPT